MWLAMQGWHLVSINAELNLTGSEKAVLKAQKKEKFKV